MNRTEFYLHPRSRHGISHAAALCGCLLLLAACGTDDGAPDMPQAGRPIGFSTNVEGRQNRSGELTAANLLSTGIFAYYTGSDDWTAADTPNFMYNQEVKRTDASSPWTYSPVKYWPNNPADKISFFAYAPYNAAGVTPCGNTVAGFPYLDYTVPTAEAGQTDLLAATPLMNQSYANTPVTPGDPTTQGKISFNMQHALTKVSIYAKSSDLSAGKVVNSLSVTAPKSGRLTYKADGFGWNPSADKSTYTATATNVTIAPATTDETVLLGTFYLIPDRANSSLNITYTLTGSISDNVNPPTDNIVITAKAFPDTYDWTPGTSINYTVNIGRTGLDVTANNINMEWSSGGVDKIMLFEAKDLKMGDYYYSDGTTSDGGLRAMVNGVAQDYTAADTESGKTVLGVVFYVGRHPEDNGDYIDKNGNPMTVHGYVINRTEGTDQHHNGGGTNWGTFVSTTDFNGYFNTQKLQAISPGYNDMMNYVRSLSNAPQTTSGWFLPSIGQLIYIKKNYSQVIDKSFQKCGGVMGRGWQHYYWTSTEVNASNSYNINWDSGSYGSKAKNSGAMVRTALAF